MIESNRRHFIATAALALAGAPLMATARPRAVDPKPLPLGVATYSLREFGRAEAIDMMQQLKAEVVSIKSFHLPYELPPAELKAAAGEFRRAGFEVSSSGNNSITEDTDEHVRSFFEYAKAAGIPMLVIAPKPDILPRIEKFVKAYDIAVAIHNHGPEDEFFPAPSDAVKLIRNLDPRVGLCVDVGHTARTGKDVVQEIADAGGRVLDMHMKDLRDLSDKDSQCIVGEGEMPVPDIFRQLLSMGYDGSINLEYEIDARNPLPGMKLSMAYMRGVRAAIIERT